MKHTVLVTLVLLSGSARALVQPAPVPIPQGETPLSELGIYQVCYQSYGRDLVIMPSAWTGHFDAVSGISYAPGEEILGRSAILLHSPWRVPPGKTFVDYPLRLPPQGPITLKFGIAMKPEVAAPGKSDGVTFSCCVVDTAGEHELLREHYTTGEWKNYTLDLAPYAGKEVTLRLQVEPGPANNASFDYSYFGGAVIVAGTGLAGGAALGAYLDSKALGATAHASLAALTNNANTGVVPSNILAEFSNSVVKKGTCWQFAYVGDDCRIVYTYTPASGTLDDFAVTIDDAPAFPPALGGGVTAISKRDGHNDTQFLRGGGAHSIELTPDGKALLAEWEYPLVAGTVCVNWRFGIRGKALTVEADCAEPILSGFSLGHEGNVPFRKLFSVPYLMGSISYLTAERVFACRYLDWTVSRSSMCPQGDASYEPKTDGTRNVLHESGYIAISPNVDETLPNLPHPPSPYRELLGPRIMLDIWGHHQGTYQGDAENLRDLKDNGIDHLAIISHVWQRFGYDVKLPDHLPADPQFGGDDGMQEFGKAANECGYVWSLHENYIDLYPDAPSYDPSARVLNADGAPSKAWFNAGTGVQSYGLKCNRALDYAKRNSPEIHARFGTNSAYLDVHSCVPPWHQLDHDASQPKAAMAQLKVERDTELFQFERDTHGGPLFGEGNNHFFWAGRCDGVEAQVAGGEDHAPFLDFDLLKIHPQMVNHGMGYYERWYRAGYSQQWGADSGAPEQVDKYRAQEIAYGHAGFIGNAQTDNIQWIAKEHHLMHPLQRLANTAKPTAIEYEVNGRMAPIGAALIANQRTRQHVTYDSDLNVWVNWSKAPWQVEGRTLPQWGFLALGPDTEAETVLKGGHFADYVECPEYLFVDARASFNMPYLRQPKNIEPAIKSVEWLGGAKARITYQWTVTDTLEQDYSCFVHFTNPAVGTTDAIAFQQDHALPKPANEWKPGETVVDGPYEITIPDEPVAEYTIAMGLFKDSRVHLNGLSDAGNRILVGKLLVKRDGHTITAVNRGKVDRAFAAPEAGKADFTAHMNPEGTMVDFGKIASDGSVKVEKKDRELVVIPYPRGKAFTTALDLARIAADPPKPTDNVRVTALAARSQDELGEVQHTAQNGRLVFKTEVKNAGRYRIRW